MSPSSSPTLGRDKGKEIRGFLFRGLWAMGQRGVDGGLRAGGKVDLEAASAFQQLVV